MDKILERYRYLIDNLGEGVYFVDKDRKIGYWNDAAEKITGFRKEDVMETYCHTNILQHVDEKGNEICMTKCPLKSTIEDGEVKNAELFLHHKDGHRVPVKIRAIPIRGDDMKIEGAIEIFSSKVDLAYLTKIKELEKLAMTDQLTGIPNRAAIEKFIDEKIALYNAVGTKFGLAFIDIDHFKQVNDKFGHDIGDSVLKIVANTLMDNIRDTDLVGRWGGEEFVICLDNINIETLRKILEKLRVLVRNSQLRRDEGDIGATISIGAAIIKKGECKDDLVQRSDKSMYESKANGRNQVTVAK